VSSLFEITGKIPLILVGNKVDLENKHEITKDDISEVAKEYNAFSFLTSAKTGQNVEKMFYNLGELLVKSAID
jgi:GTPase SAR1 family protein